MSDGLPSLTGKGNGRFHSLAAVRAIRCAVFGAHHGCWIISQGYHSLRFGFRVTKVHVLILMLIVLALALLRLYVWHDEWMTSLLSLVPFVVVWIWVYYFFFFLLKTEYICMCLGAASWSRSTFSDGVLVIDQEWLPLRTMVVWICKGRNSSCLAFYHFPSVVEPIVNVSKHFRPLKRLLIWTVWFCQCRWSHQCLWGHRWILFLQ